MKSNVMVFVNLDTKNVLFFYEEIKIVFSMFTFILNPTFKIGNEKFNYISIIFKYIYDGSAY